MKKEKWNSIVEIAYSTKKGIVITLLDIFISWIFFGTSIDEYIKYNFYEKNIKLRKKYISIRNQKMFKRIINHTLKTINKEEMYNKYRNYINRDYYFYSDKNNIKDFIQDKKEIVIKSLNDKNYEELKKVKSIKDLDSFNEYLKDNNLYLEEKIIQDKKMSILANNEMVYLKVLTFSNKNKKEILYSYITFYNPIKKCNINIEIDTKYGKLKNIGIDDKLEEHKKHPISKSVFDKFQLPYWKKIKDKIIKILSVDNEDVVVEWSYIIIKDDIEFVNKSYDIDFDRIQLINKRGRKDIINYVKNNLKK